MPLLEGLKNFLRIEKVRRRSCLTGLALAKVFYLFPVVSINALLFDVVCGCVQAERRCGINFIEGFRTIFGPIFAVEIELPALETEIAVFDEELVVGVI